MKHYKYVVSVFIYCWLFSGTGYALDAAGTDGQLQYNDNGQLAGAEVYYSNQNQQLDILGSLHVDEELKIGDIGGADANFRIISAPHSAKLIINPAPCLYCVAMIELEPGFIRLVSEYTLTNWLSVGSGNIPQATLDVNGFAKLRPYNQPPVSCTTSRRGTIVLNGNYDLCICKAVFSYYPSTVRSDSGRDDSRRGDSRGPDFYPIPASVYRLVRDPSKKCW